MFFSINTEKLQSMVSDVSKGVGNNKLLPITSMIGVKYCDGKLSFTSFDGSNLLRISYNIGVEDDSKFGEVTINADMFIGLISKLSDCSSIDFETNNSILAVSAYQGVKEVGQYKLELPLNDDGDVVKYIDMDNKIDQINSGEKFSYTFTEQIVNEMLASCKQALATDTSETCYTNYLVGDKIIATDRARAVFLDNESFNGEPILLSRSFVDLLPLMIEDFSLTVSDSGMYATDSGVEIYSSFTGDIEEFDKKGAESMLGIQFPSMCKVKKAELLNTLNRMALFCNKYDNNGIDIKFDEDSITVSSLKSSAVETIEFTEFKNISPCEIYIDVSLLLSHVKAYSSDIVELHFGNPKCIKLVDGSVTQIIALVIKS